MKSFLLHCSRHGTNPLVLQDRMSNMTNVKTLYQGGSRDRPISPSLIESNGTFNKNQCHLSIYKFLKELGIHPGLMGF